MSETVWPTVNVDGDLLRARSEWIHANAAGAYASSTVACMHTRRYHGLLVAALEPPRRRHVIISHVDATVLVDGRPVGLATHQFPAVAPTEGHRFLSLFAQDPLPHWVYRLAEGELDHTLALARGRNALVLRYMWHGTRPIRLELRPLLAVRPFHALMREYGAMVHRVEMRQGEVSVRPVESLPRIVFRHRGNFVGSPDWWRRFEYLAERDRGLDFIEDLWTPGVFRVGLEPNESAYLVGALNDAPKETPEMLMEETRQALLSCDPGPSRPWAVRRLSVAADLFRADLASPPGVIAGYPWFEMWGRHTLMSVPGLYLTTGRSEDAKRVISPLIEYMRDGIVPNRLPDDGRPPEYHAVDATLWLLHLGGELARSLGDDPFVKETLYPAMCRIFQTCLEGTADGIHVTPYGLLAAGRLGTSLTWMDARVNGTPITSRAGLPVEIQALWTKGCESLAHVASLIGDEQIARSAQAACDKARAEFASRFWCETTNYPHDVISELDGWVDCSIRPNAVLALATDPLLFTEDQAKQVVNRAREHLLTPAGLRTLSPTDSAYCGTYNGSIGQRDCAYHQGTAWFFLLGAYIRAVRTAYPDDSNQTAELQTLVENALRNVGALGQVPELASGDPPHTPDGCIAHAAGVAELLRALVEDLGR